MSTYVETTVSDGVATLTLDRAERHNSLIPPLLRELHEAIEAAQRDSAVRVLILRTAGSAFSTGGDVAAFYEHRDEIGAYADRTVGRLNDVILALRRSPDPVIVAVDGIVTGGALGFVLASDIAIVSPEAELTPYYSVVGFSPDGGWTAILPNRIGVSRTVSVLVTNETITPETAVRWGIATELVGTGDAVDRAEEVARTVAGMRRGAVRAAKRLVRPDDGEIESRLAAERRAFCSQIRTDEAMAGMEAFLDIA